MFVPWIEDGFELPKAILLRLGSLLLAASCLLRRESEEGAYPRAGGLDRPVAAFLAVAAFFTLSSIHPHLSFFGQYRLYSGGLWSFLSCGLLYAVVSRLPTEAARTSVSRSILGAGLLVLLYAAAQHAGWDPFPWRAASRLHPIATFGSPFKFAPFLALLLPVAISAYWLSPPGLQRPFWLAFIAAAIFELLATMGRGAWLGSIVAVFLWMGLNWEEVKGQRARLLRLLGLILCLLVVLGLFGPPSIQWRMAVFLNRHEGSAANRLELWGIALRVIADAKGWGRGLETFGLVSPAFETVRFREGVGVSEIATNAHNEFLHILVTMGVLGAAAYAWLWAGFFRLAWRTISATASRDRVLLSGLFCGAVAHWVYAQFNFGTTATSAYVWAFMGVLAGAPPEARPWAGSVSRGPWLRRGVVGLIAVLFLSGAYRSARELAADRYFTLMQSWGVRQQWLKAAEAGKKAVALNPWGGYYSLSLAAAYRSLSQLSVDSSEKARWYGEASGVFKAHLERYPRDADAHHNYAMSLMWRALEFKEPVLEVAVEEEKKAIALAPLFPDFLNALGQMHHFAGRIEEAKSAWVRAVDVAPGYAPALEWLERYVPRDVFQATPSEVEAADLPLGRPVVSERERPLAVKIANMGEKALSFRVDVVAARGHPFPSGYEASAAVRVRPLLPEFEVPPNGVVRVPLEIFVPKADRFRNRKFYAFVRLRCLNFDVPVERIIPVLIRTSGAST